MSNVTDFYSFSERLLLLVMKVRNVEQRMKQETMADEKPTKDEII
jgi:hypothetical protein